MSVITDLQGTWETKEKAEDAFTVRAQLENVSNVLLETNTAIQAIVDNGNFGTVPADLRNALNRWWTIFKDAQSDAEADAEIVQIYQWRP